MLDCRNFIVDRSDVRLDKALVHLELCQRPSGQRIVQARIVGHLGSGDLGRIFHVLDESPSFDVALPTFWDLREFDFALQSPTVLRTSLFSLQHFPKRRNTPRGILVANEIGFGMTRMYQETAAGYQIENAGCFMISYCEKTVMAWLCRRQFAKNAKR